MTPEVQPVAEGRFDPYLVPDDWARLQYGRLLWKRDSTRERLLRHWSDPRHPYCERFLRRYRDFVVELLEASAEQDEDIDRCFRERGQSLRTVVREIPPVFGSFY